MDEATRQRIKKHLTSMQGHLEQALHEAEQAEGCGAEALPRYDLEDVLEVLAMRLVSLE